MFMCELNEPCNETKWLKDGHDIVNSAKYLTQIEDDIFHHLIVRNVGKEDEGIYTFKVVSHLADTKVVVEGGSQLRTL